MNFARFGVFCPPEKKKQKKAEITIFTLFIIFHLPYFNLGKKVQIMVCVGIKSELQIIVFYKNNEKLLTVPAGDTGAYMLSLGSGQHVFSVHPHCSCKLFLQNWLEEIQY